jgi:hypothetical protein
MGADMEDTLHVAIDCLTGQVSTRQASAQEHADRLAQIETYVVQRQTEQEARSTALNLVRERADQDPAFAALIRLQGIDLTTAEPEKT